MNREQALHYAEIFQAIADGKTVQLRRTLEPVCDWSDVKESTTIMSGNPAYEYRVKPEPKEFWLCWHDVLDEGTPRERPDAIAYPVSAYSKGSVSNWKNAVKVRVIDDE